MTLRLPKFKVFAYTFAGLVVLYLLFGWLALPFILQNQAEKFIVEKTGHHLTMNRPEFNPIKLSLHLSGLHLTQPQGEPLLSFHDLVIEVSPASIYRRTLTFNTINLDGFEATVIMLPDNQLNWSGLINALKSKDKEEKPESPLPRLDIHSFVLAGAKIDFTDKRIQPAFSTRIEPMDIKLNEVSTLPNEKGQYRISAQTSLGARIALNTEASLNPLSMTGNLSIENVDLARLETYFKDKLPIAPPAGIAGVSTDYRISYAAGHLKLNLDHASAKLSNLKLHQNSDSAPVVTVDSVEAKEGSFDLVKNYFALGSLNVAGSKLDLHPRKSNAQKAFELGSLALEDIHVNLASHQATLGHIDLKNADAHITRDAQGRIDLMEAFQSAAPPAQSSQQKKVSSNSHSKEVRWHYQVKKFDLTGFNTFFRDESVAPAAELALNDITLGAEDISEDMTAGVPLRLSFKTGKEGHFQAEGKVVPTGPTADIQLKLNDLSLEPAQPYLSNVVKLKLVDGRLSTAGHLIYNTRDPNYRGNFALRKLRLNEAETGDLFLSLASLGSRSFTVSPKKLDMGELVITGLDTKLIIEKDKSVSIKHILRQPATPATASASPTPPVAPDKTTPTHPFAFNIDRLRVVSSEMDFADYSLALPFGTRIHDLNGVITGISSRQGAPGQIELNGQVDDFGLARAAGQIDLLNPTDFMDLKVLFSNIEMTRLTPYSATFAGRKIASGKLSLDLEYKIHQHQLQGENQVVMNQLTLGEKVDSPEAKSLPLDLAIAILEDSDGRIDLGLPVSGSLDDPQFSYGGIVWKAIVNVFTKIATAPFRALGSLFGGNEKFESIAFEAGDAQLTPPEREKLVKLAGAMSKRPKLSLELHGTYAEKDRVALQDRQLRRNVLEKSGQHIEGESDPGPIPMHQPKIRSALEAMFSESFGSNELSALKEGFRQANPGQLEESRTGKMMSQLSGLIHKNRSLTGQEITDLKGTDFYTVLFDRLRTKMPVDDKKLQALATARGEYAATELKAAGASAERIEVLAAEKVESEGTFIPLKLVPGAAKSAQPAVPAATSPVAK
jgi:hypothetical protein